MRYLRLNHNTNNTLPLRYNFKTRTTIQCFTNHPIYTSKFYGKKIPEANLRNHFATTQPLMPQSQNFYLISHASATLTRQHACMLFSLSYVSCILQIRRTLT